MGNSELTPRDLRTPIGQNNAEKIISAVDSSYNETVLSDGTRVSWGAVADGQFTKRVGTNFVGAGAPFMLTFTDVRDALAAATTDVGFNSFGVTGVKYLDLEVLPEPAYKRGRLYFDPGDHVPTAMTDASDVRLNIGLETFIRIVNKTGALLEDTKAVYISGAQGNRPTASYADNTSDTSVHAIGLMTHNVGINDEGFCTIIGTVSGINTSGFAAGDELFVGLTGDLTKVKPSGVNKFWSIGWALNSTNNGKVLVLPHGPSHLADQHDVSDGTPTSGNILVGNGTSWTTAESSSIVTDYAVSTNTNHDVGARNEHVSVIARGASVAVKLPASPFNGQRVTVKDQGNVASTHNITVNGNGKTIDGAGSLVINTNRGYRRMVYAGLEWEDVT